MPTTPDKTVFLLAGEASGDLLGAALIRALKKQSDGFRFTGVGGQKMLAEGQDQLTPSSALAVMGIFAVLWKLPTIARLLRSIKAHFKKQPPDLVVLIDFSGFNLRVAKLAKKAGLKVLFYVSPKIWAWHYSRIKKIQAYVDHMAVFFAFEQKLYEKAGVPVTLVGHPLNDAIPPTPITPTDALGLDPEEPIVALYPGSRQQEIQALLPTIIAAAERLSQQIPQIQFVLPVADTLDKTAIEKMTRASTCTILLVAQAGYAPMQLCDAAIACSGTVTLELALHQVPHVVIYKMDLLSFWLAKRLVRCKQIALANIVAEQEVAKELIQSDATPAHIAIEVTALLQDEAYRTKRIAALQALRNHMGPYHCAEKTAQVVTQLLEHRSA